MNTKNPFWSVLDKVNSADYCLLDIFSNEPERLSDFSCSFGDFTLDFSKQLLTAKDFHALCDSVKSIGLPDAIEALLTGEKVNHTENRAALHTALRSTLDNPVISDNVNLTRAVHDTLETMEHTVDKILSKQWRGFSGKAITDIVNIGVGGSDLGPQLACHALQDFTHPDAANINIHFVSSIDGSQIKPKLKKLNPETTLFIVSSKSFSTIDTFSNADTAIAWMQEALPDIKLIMKNHFIGVSSKPDLMSQWGLPETNQIKFWDWVGGRFSLWSGIGLSIAIKIGMSGFRALLSGAHAMDNHFAEAPFEQNIPVILGLLGVWNSSALNINAHTVLPYDGRLQLFPNYLTQLEMESNGKSVDRSGKTVNYNTCPILWGDIGPNAQHAFYQLLHQGTQKVSCDFIGIINRYHDNNELEKQHKLSLANCLGQSRVLAFGNHALNQDIDKVQSHKRYRGNQPSTTLLINELTPYNLGALIAAYEHKVYVMSVIWDINPFDQWGVELGKSMSSDLLEALCSDNSSSYDQSTHFLLNTIKGL